MVEIRPIMNSCAEDVLSFKTCCGLRMFEQNLEIHLENRGAQRVVLQGYFDLIGEYGEKRITTLTPPGKKVIDPDETIACYCYMDEDLWNRSRSLRFYDRDGAAYEAVI
jgi:hypothetical protein